MKLQIPLWLAIAATLACIVWAVCDAQLIPTSRLTSDASKSPHGLPMPPMPNQSGIFVPPSTLIYTEFRTSTVPLVVEITVTSNIIRRDVFWMAGKPVTNDFLMTNFLVSRSTNEVVR